VRTVADVGSPVPDESGFVRVSPFEFAAGWVPGYVSSTADGPPVRRPPDPVGALENVLRDALQHDPCVIGFSGGRDSSALLAVAVRVARREGLPLPVPVTKRYPAEPTTDERTWQELVIRWLDLDDWVQHDYHDELDLLGPSASESLLRHGLLWPGSAHNRAPTLAVAEGGAYVDGEGGDEILGTFRITPLAQVLRRERPLDRRARREVGYAIAPRLARSRIAVRRIRAWNDRTWLRHDVVDWYLQTALADELAVAGTYAAGLRQLARRRAAYVALTNLDAIGRSLGVRYVHPFFDPSFVESLARFGGRLGFTSRTATMRALFHDLLPDQVNARESKAYFNNAFIHGHSREFIRNWDGSGLDDQLVDPDELRRVWEEDWVHSGTFQLLQAAWLAAQGTVGPVAGSRSET
jgi:asparagine synthetase B (glutamine-hydrolysing)